MIRIMSSNVWGNCPADAPICNRDDNLSVIYHRYLPDVIGMQEVSPKSRAEADNIITLNGDIYKEVPVDFSPFPNNYTPMLYRSDRLALGFSGYLNYKGLNDAGSKSLVWAHFTERYTGNRFLVINTHYYWTNDDPGREARVSNSHELLDLLADLEARYPGIPVFFTGDFNCRSREEPIQMLFADGIRESRLETVGEKPSLCSHHGYPKREPADGVFTVPAEPKPDADESIDHVFFKGDLRVINYQVIVDRESLLATDHCPIFADFA